MCSCCFQLLNQLKVKYTMCLLKLSTQMATRNIRHMLIVQLGAQLHCYLYSKGFTLGNIILYLCRHIYFNG